jgi:phosphate acetyltransferase
MAFLSNYPYDELTPGLSTRIEREISAEDIERFAALSGDANPTHLDQAFARGTVFRGVVAHGMWSGLLISRVLGTVLPGPGTIYLRQSLKFERPVRPGDRLTVEVTVKEKRGRGRVLLSTMVYNAAGEVLTEGEAEVIAPQEKLRLEVPELPTIYTRDHEQYGKLLHVARRVQALKVAVVHPCTPEAMEVVFEGAAEALMVPVLIGPRTRIEAAAASLGRTINDFELIATEHSEASAAVAAELARTGKVQALMKGSLHTAELLGAALGRSTGLRTSRRLSHCYLIDYPGRDTPLIVTDAAVNITPTLEDKIDICQNAIDLARTLEIHEPKVAVLSAVETINPKLPGTLDAAALCKMAQRGQITGGVIDGPLAYDNAIDPEAARIKGIGGPVAGHADILLVPNLEAGNLLVKQLTFTSGMDAAGIVLGARVPIVLTSRADSQRTRLASLALAKVVAAAAAVGRFGGPRHAPNPDHREAEQP